MDQKQYSYPILLLLLGILFFFPGLGHVHLFDWDEINFAEISREMFVTGNYSQVFINFQPFWEKPPLFFWLQVAAMKIFGVNEFAARLPNALCGLITLLLLFFIGKKHYNERFGFLWSITYFGSLLPHLYFRSGIIDPVFNLFIFLGLYGLITAYWKMEEWLPKASIGKVNSYLFGGGLILGLAVLTKGPVAILIVGLCIVVYWVLEKFRWYLPFTSFLVFGFGASLLTILWFGIETVKNGDWFVREFITYQIKLLSTEDAGHGGFPGYHFVVLLIGCFPASIFALGRIFSSKKENNPLQDDFIRWMKILFWVVLILFSIVQSKIVHYSSLAYFPLTYLAAVYLHGILRQQYQLARGIKIGILFTGGIYILALLVLPFIAKQPELLTPYIADPFAKASFNTPILLTGFESIAGIWLLLVLILFWRLSRNNFYKSVQVLFIGNACFIFITLFFWINRIEYFSQGPAIEFWEEIATKDAYTMTYEFKSYAPLFYGKKRVGLRQESTQADWLLKGAIDKPVYFIAKIHKAKKLAKYPDIQEIGRKNGFVFFVRYPSN